MSAIDAFVHGVPAAGAAKRHSRWLGPGLAFLAMVAVAIVTVQPPSSGIPFDPESVDATGLRGVVDVLRALDVEVLVTGDLSAVAAHDVVLVPPLGWTDEQVRALAARGGRTVAVIAPDADVAPAPLGVAGVGLVDLEADCDLFRDVETLRSASWTGWLLTELSDRAASEACLVRGDTAWLVRTPVGDGELVALGSMAPFVNDRLLDSDAAVAAVRLLAPTGPGRVVALRAPDGAPALTLTDLIDPRWFDAAWLSLLALLLVALARGRRLGRPVSEELPVRVPSGELARAIGDLRQRAGLAAASGEVLRDRTLAAARRRLGLPLDADAEAVLDELRRQGRRPSAAAAAALRGPAPDDEDGLVAAARALAELRATLRGGAAREAATNPQTSTAPDQEDA